MSRILLLLTALALLGIEQPLLAEEKVDLKRDLELWLPLQGGFRDFSKNHHIGEVMGNLRIEREGAYFDGEGDHILFPSFDFRDKPFAISMWIRSTGDFGNCGIIQQKSANRKREWFHLVLRERMQPFFSFYVVSTMAKSTLRNTDGWRHLVVQYSGNKSEIYVDGKLDVSRATPSFLGEGGKFVVGLTPKWSNVPSSDFEGYLSDFRVYKRALNKSEIRYLASMSSE